MNKTENDFVNVNLPELGEGILEATITKYLVSVGDLINEDEPIAEVSTDKVDTEIHSLYSGVVEKLLYKENQIAKIGEPILIIKQQKTASDNPIEDNRFLDNTTSQKEHFITPINNTNQIEQKNTNGTPTIAEDKKDYKILDTENISFFSPLVKSICRIEGISKEELKTIAGTGKEGRITKNDLFAFLEKRNNPTHFAKNQTIECFVPKELEERIEMSRTRKLISQRMSESVKESPHVTSFLETDVTRIVKWRDKNKEDFEKENGFKVTYLPIIIRAVVDTLKEYPMVNISVEDETIIKKNYINIGIATALDSGELIVPVIKNAHKLSFLELCKEVNDLIYRSRMGMLNTNDVVGGTYTISNIGTFGNLFGTPIINQPQCAILAIGSIEKKPAVVETELGDTIAIRHKMFLSHSYDHRVIDGYLGGSFLKSLSNRLENFSGI